jgi:glycerol-3-phosphate acyltransferase PlsX
LKEIVITVDAMGGDYGPEVTVPASIKALNTHPNLKLILVGESEMLQALLAQHPAKVGNRLTIHHASQQVSMDESPSQALRTKKDSSMRVAINLVKEKIAQACVSAGNTGALMATARFVLKTLPGIDRPAIITTFPTIHDNKQVRLLDLGANVDSYADHLYQFAVMGSVLVSQLEGVEFPRVGLLNIGQEEIKGNDQVKQTAQLLSESKAINYYGYIEGDKIFSGEVDVVVCDGFVGNVVLKTMEGVARLILDFAREEFKRTWYSRFAAFVGLPVLQRLKHRLDPGRRNGASLIGLQGIVIKSHGSANIMAFAQAIHEAVLEVEHDIPRKIGQEVGLLLEDNT